MKSNKLNVIATSIIASTAMLTIMAGLYFNLRILGFRRVYNLVLS